LPANQGQQANTWGAQDYVDNDGGAVTGVQMPRVAGERTMSALEYAGLVGTTFAIATGPATVSAFASGARWALSRMFADDAAKGAVEGLGFTRSQLQHGFKHAKDFGVGGNANNKTLSEFSSALQSHVDAAGTRAIQGTYRGNPAMHHVDPSTGLNVIRDSSGNFLSGWKLSPQQLQHVLTTGKLGGN
jgi:hypothetical protein